MLARQQEPDVAMQQWVVATDDWAGGEVGGRVQEFARSHGMSDGESGIVGILVTAVVTEAGLRDEATPERGSILIDAATDGDDLSVRIADQAQEAGMVAVFEFSMHPPERTLLHAT